MEKRGMIKHFRLLTVKILYSNVCLMSRLRNWERLWSNYSCANQFQKDFGQCQCYVTEKARKKKKRIPQVTVGSKRQRLEAGILGLFQISTHLDAFNTEHLLNASNSLGQRESSAIRGLQLPDLKNWSEYQFILLEAGLTDEIANRYLNHLTALFIHNTNISVFSIFSLEVE